MENIWIKKQQFFFNIINFLYKQKFNFNVSIIAYFFFLLLVIVILVMNFNIRRSLYKKLHIFIFSSQKYVKKKIGVIIKYNCVFDQFTYICNMYIVKDLTIKNVYTSTLYILLNLIKWEIVDFFIILNVYLNL